MAAQHQRIVVTGASRGLGLEFCRQYLQQGHEVAALARAAKESRGLDELAAEHGERFTPIVCDVGDDASVEAAAKEIGRRWERVDVLVNNAGVYGDKGPLSSLDLDAVMRTFSINTLGPLRTTRALLPLLRRSDGAKVVHVTSKMGSIDDNTSGGSWSYRISKTALNMACANLAHELRGEGIPTAVLHPGWVRTDMGGEHAPLSTEESVAGMIRVVEGLGMDGTGSFLAYDGSAVAW